MATTIVALVVLAVFNFLVSVIQGVVGVGDAIFLQVLWSLACELAPSHFNTTPLGPEPVRAVAILMYVRLLLVAPLIVYIGYHDSIFSLSMTVAMAVPSTVLSIAGVYLFAYLNAEVLKLILGVSSLLFALAYVVILVVRQLRRRRRLAALQQHHVKIVVEADALAEELHRSRNASIDDLHASFVLHVPNNSLNAMPVPAAWSPQQQQHQRHAHATHDHTAPSPAIPATLSLSFVGGSAHAHATAARRTTADVHPDTGLPPDVHEAYVSTITGDIFTAAEAAMVPLHESNVPPLTTRKLSPSRTLTHTRVRVNRNLNAQGKVRRRTKIGAAVAASAAGLMASLTGVNAPPQIIFILLYDAPNYIVRVNFCAQSIPGSLVRFAMALGRGIFTWQQLPLLVVTAVFGTAGVFAGNRIGRLLGPQSFNLFVLCILLLSALVMLSHSAMLLLVCMLVMLVATVAAAYYEHTTTQPVVEAQRQVEMEIERRVYDVMEQLRHSRVFGSVDGAGGTLANFSIMHSFADMHTHTHAHAPPMAAAVSGHFVPAADVVVVTSAARDAHDVVSDNDDDTTGAAAAATTTKTTASSHAHGEGGGEHSISAVHKSYDDDDVTTTTTTTTTTTAVVVDSGADTTDATQRQHSTTNNSDSHNNNNNMSNCDNTNNNNNKNNNRSSRRTSSSHGGVGTGGEDNVARCDEHDASKLHAVAATTTHASSVAHDNSHHDHNVVVRHDTHARV